MGSPLDADFIIATLTGKGGDGKSYLTVQELATRRMVRKNNRLITNLPLRLDEFCQYVADRRLCDPDEVRERITIIPKETLSRWRDGEGGPWELCDENGFDRPTDLVIDEAHEFCSGPDKQWRTFLGEARHLRLKRVLFLTQSVKKVSPEIDKHAKVRLRIEKGDSHRTPWFGVSMGDVYQLIASITGVYQPYVHLVEQTQDASEKWVDGHSDAFKFNSEIFGLYDTHSEAGGSSEAGEATHDPQEWERRPRLLPGRRDYNENGKPVLTAPTWLWFLAVNALAMGKLAAVAGVMIFLISGGAGWLLGQWTEKTQAAIRQNFGGGGPRAELTTQRVSNGQDAPGGCGCGKKAALIQELATRLDPDLEGPPLSERVFALAPGFVRFGAGDLARVGTVIEGGPFDGSTLEAIDFPGRRLRLDGRWLRVQVGGILENEDKATELRELLSRARVEGQAETDAPPREQSILVASGGGDAAGGDAQPAEPDDQPQLRR